MQEWRADSLINDAHQSNDAKDYRKSIDTLKQAAALAPKYPQVWYELCVTYQYAGEYDLAIQSCQRQVDLNPTAESYAALGWAYWPKHDYAHAASVFQLAVAKSDDPIIQDHYLWSLLGAKQYDKAVPAAERLIEEIKKDSVSPIDVRTSIECLGVAYSETAQTAKAQEAFREAGVESCRLGFDQSGNLQISCQGIPSSRPH